LLRDVLRISGFGEFLIAGAGFGCRTSSSGQGEYSQDPNLAMQGKRDHRSNPHLFRSLLDPLPVDPDAAPVDQGLGQRATFQKPDEKEKSVEAQRLSLQARQH
jgi:hypothetical protein